MYCSNCGKEMNENADFCTACGVARGKGNNFCSHCGAAVMPDAQVCVTCGCALKNTPATGAKSKLAAGLMAILIGSLGVHNFYLGYTSRGIVQLLVSVILCWTIVAPIAIEIWAIVEGVKILQGEVTDANGNALCD